ncbi:MAG TPA: response regulator transcription factor [Ferruginibacter sp.]|nr:response regulator transcription factor [Ferruginibacter sp.]
MITVGIVDDHQLFSSSLSIMLENFQKYKVVVDAVNGKDLQLKISSLPQHPDLLLIDVNMPVMDGIETAYWVRQNYPHIKMVALSMNNDDKSIINMIKAGCCAYLLKDTHPDEFERALEEIYTRGFYNADVMNINFRRLLVTQHENSQLSLTEREREFLALACSELTYKQIAVEMELAERTVDGYRETLFKKFNVQSRVGLVMEALRKKFVQL